MLHYHKINLFDVAGDQPGLCQNLNFAGLETWMTESLFDPNKFFRLMRFFGKQHITGKLKEKQLVLN